jgi:hypothetical protein
MVNHSGGFPDASGRSRVSFPKVTDLTERHMKTIAFVFALALAGSAAAATSSSPARTQICLDVSGATLPVVCSVPSSRLDSREYFCSCPDGERVDVAICPTGVKPPAENLALNRARRAAVRDGSLMGDRIDDRPICMAPRNP